MRNIFKLFVVYIRLQQISYCQIVKKSIRNKHYVTKFIADGRSEWVSEWIQPPLPITRSLRMRLFTG